MHMKKLAAPRTWPIKRRDQTFMTSPLPGGKFELGMPLNVIFKEMLGYAATSKEVKRVLNTKNVLVSGSRVKEPRFLVGLFDTIAIDETSSYHRIVLNDKGKIEAVQIKKEESNVKLSKVIGKAMLRKKRIQLNLSDGRNMIIEKDTYKTGDTLMISLPDNAIKKHVKLDKNAMIFLTGGKHIGETGIVQGISKDKITYKSGNGEVIETMKSHAFAIGEEKPLISINQMNY